MIVITITLAVLVVLLLVAVITMYLRRKRKQPQPVNAIELLAATLGTIGRIDADLGPPGELPGVRAPVPARQRLSEELAARGYAAPSLPVVVGDPDKLCRTCAHFDLEDGQAMAAAHGPFMMAAAHIPPAEMGAVATPEGEVEARDIPPKAKWQEFGLCAHRSEGLWGNTDAKRRARMQDDDGVVGGFLEDGIDCYVAKP